MLRKQAATHGTQWDYYLHSVLWAYHNTPHETTDEKPSFLFFEYNCRTLSEATLLSPSPLDPTAASGYREQVIRDLAVRSIREAQMNYKRLCDRP